MEAKDLFITPLVILLVVVGAYMIRPLVATNRTKKYFLPALLLKIIGAISLGLIYQFYYGAGDTFNYYHHGTLHIWEAFLDSPIKAFQLIFANGVHQPETFEYSSKIWTFRDLPSYFVVRVGGLFSLITFNTYSAIAVLFAVFSFSGSWAMYLAMLKFYPSLRRWLAYAIFFCPSVVFWGSGLMKDTLTLGALGWLFWAMVGVFFVKRRMLMYALVGLVAAYMIYSIKIYIVLCFIPAALLWIGFDRFVAIQSLSMKLFLTPIFGVLIIGFGYLAISEVGQGNARYSLDNIGYAAEVTARWINYVSEVEGGAGYTLGDFDYSPMGMIRKFFPAVFVTLFQPFLWQANSPIMLLSALESLTLFLLTIWILRKSGIGMFFTLLRQNALFLFGVVFTLSFAAAVGFSTYNFGSLVRYKIPLLPFYGMVLALLFHFSKRHPQRYMATW